MHLRIKMNIYKFRNENMMHFIVNDIDKFLYSQCILLHLCDMLSRVNNM